MSVLFPRAGWRGVFRERTERYSFVTRGQEVAAPWEAISTNSRIFFAQRPQQPLPLRLNFALRAQGVTCPFRPASRTSDSVIPLQRHTYMGTSMNDYEKHSQYASTWEFCQARFNRPGVRGFAILKPRNIRTRSFPVGRPLDRKSTRLNSSH